MQGFEIYYCSRLLGLRASPFFFAFEGEEVDASEGSQGKAWEYLLGMPIWPSPKCVIEFEV